MKQAATIVASFLIAMVTGALASDVGEVIQCSGKPVPVSVPFVVFGFCAALVVCGYWIGRNDEDH